MGPLTTRRLEQEDDPTYICCGCGEAFDLEYYTCPECGGYSVERARFDQSVTVGTQSRPLLGRLMAGLKRRVTIDQTRTESNTARIRR